jgi:hypothetical protein
MGMHRTTPHRQSKRLVLILCMIIITIMLSNAVAAHRIATAECNGDCCCCPMPDQDAYPKIRGIRTNGSGCCSSNGTGTTCRMASTGQPETLPAVIRIPCPHPVDTGQLLPASFQNQFPPLSTGLPDCWTDTVSRFASTRLYLRTCRLIC